MSLPPARYILPNIFTLSAALCGFVSIWVSTQATEGSEFYLAAGLIALAVFLDGFDGRVARMTGGQSKMGAQLDSFSDFLTFGVAPAMLVYSWGLRPLGGWGLIAVFVFAACAMLRLARFNVAAEEEGEGVSRYFTGLPSPMGGLAVALLVGLNTGVLGREVMAEAARPSLVIFVVLIGLLMVSNVPFRTFKDLRPTWSTRLLIASIIVVQVLVTIRVDYMVALSIGLFGYFVFHLTGGLVTATRVVRVRVSKSGELIEEYDDSEDGEDD